MRPRGLRPWCSRAAHYCVRPRCAETHENSWTAIVPSVGRSRALQIPAPSIARVPRALQTTGIIRRVGVLTRSMQREHEEQSLVCQSQASRLATDRAAEPSLSGAPGSCPTGTGSLFSTLLNCDTVDTFENLDLMPNTMSQTLQPAARRRMSCGDGNHLHLTGDDARLGGT